MGVFKVAGWLHIVYATNKCDVLGSVFLWLEVPTWNQGWMEGRDGLGRGGTDGEGTVPIFRGRAHRSYNST